MKRLLTILLCVITLLSFCACSGETDSTQETKETTTAANTVKITFPEGYTITQMGELLEENNVCTLNDFISAIEEWESLDYGFTAEISNPEERAFVLEGYVFPDTYEFYFNEGGKKALSRFLKNTDKKLTEDMYTQADTLGYTMDEIIAIASIIQKEADIVGEMNTVSSVIHNRLNASYNRLECDVTIHYLEKYVKPYLTEDKDKYNELYNTYKCYGLPAGPICNPGIAAIKAALYPEDTDYMFFVTDSDMNYYYAETYEEHLANCKKCGY